MPPKRKKAEPVVQAEPEVQVVQAEPEVAEPALQPMPTAAGPPVIGQVVVVRRAPQFSGPMWHPDQSKYIPDDVNGVEVIYDNWLRCQLTAKLVEIVP